MTNLRAGHAQKDSGKKPVPHEKSDGLNSDHVNNTDNQAHGISGRVDSSFWLTTLGPLGSVR